MESTTNFRTIEELVKVLDREKALFRDMFERRKSLAYRMDFAMEIVDYKRERIQFLIDHGVIHENGDFLELEDVYVQFFEEVLEMNEEISISSVKEYLDSLNENINYYLQETNENRKNQYQSIVRKALRRIGLRTLKNVIDLKRNVDTAYKQEPNYKIKKSRLVNLDEKRKGIKVLIQESEKMIEGQVVFFKMSTDPEMQRTVLDVRNDFTEADHNLLEIERQIIDYINQIEQQSILFKKIRKIKYLKDQLTWQEDTNIVRMIEGKNPLWMENRPYNRIFLSLDMLQSNEEAYNIIRKIVGRSIVRRLARTEADPLDENYMNDNIEEVNAINMTELWNAFKAQGNHLFAFIKEYPYKRQHTLGELIIIYCQMVTLHSNELRITDDYDSFDKIEYALIYAN
jgi:cobalamin biosynthesis Mg chelatase CobN